MSSLNLAAWAFARRVVQAFDPEIPVCTVCEDVGRAVHGLGDKQLLKRRRHVHQDIALVVLERLARKSALVIRAPEERGARAEILGQNLDDLILVAVLVHG